MRRAHILGADADDFSSFVRLKLIDRDFAVLRKWAGPASFESYVTVVVHNLLADYQAAQWGKWRSSAEARRLGEAAIALESILLRDGRTLDDALLILRARWPQLCREDVERIASRLPRRMPRRRVVNLSDVASAVDRAASPEALAIASEGLPLAEVIETIVRATIGQLRPQTRRLLQLRFGEGLTIVEIARRIGCRPKSLYRQCSRALRLLRQRLEVVGISRGDVGELIATARDLDFGLGEQGAACPTPPSETEGG